MYMVAVRSRVGYIHDDGGPRSVCILLFHPQHETTLGKHIRGHLK